jgi:4-amino-4-deoxy-L-arabinose transferase-like glycosyltransferase
MMNAISRFLASLNDPVAERRVLIAILVLAAAVRLACIPVVAAITGYLPDVLAYRQAAADLLRGHLISDNFVMPGYPLIIMFAGGMPLVQEFIDIAISVVGIWCLARIVRELTGDALSGLLAGLLWALYPFAIFYTVIGLSESAFVTAMLLGFLAYYRKQFFLGNLAMVAAILIRPSVELLVPVLIIAFALVVHRERALFAARQIGVFALVYLVLMAPWWWHNYEKYHAFVPLNLSGGLVLYTGNNPMNHTGGGIGGVDVERGKFAAIKDPLQRDRALRQAAIAYIRDNPGRFVELALLKFKRLWQPWPHASEYATPALIAVSVVSYLPILLLALLGAVLGMRRFARKLVPILLFFGYMTAVHMVTIASLRYRFPMEPFLVALAAPVLAFGLQRRATDKNTPAPAKALS